MSGEPLTTVAVRVNFWVNQPLQVKVFSPKQWGTVSLIHFVSKQQLDTVHMFTEGPRTHYWAQAYYSFGTLC